ncbi:MAG: hypothetical protein IKT50_01615 [Clostridia bacterium]|nr:hypothetical protein [Clostridia bacterium]
MAKKEYAAEILKQMEDGTEEIFARYQNLIRAAEASFESKKRALDSQYRKEARLASARAEVDLKNTLERMADSGYIRSGETVQAQAFANAQRAGALSALATQNAEDTANLEAEKLKASNELLAEAQKETQEHKTELLRARLEQANLDREYEAKRQQEAYENQLAAQKLAQESAKQSQENKAFEPEKSPYDYLNEIVKKNTTYNKKKGYKVIDRKAILLGISRIVKDKNISYRYRYELYLYGKTLGYISE